MSLVFRDAFWQISWRIISALAGFLVVKLITPYLGPLRYGDYSTILKYFAIWSALADFWIYVLALSTLGKIKNTEEKLKLYHKFLWFRFFMVAFVYITAFIIALLIPAYFQNSFILYGLVLWMLFSATFMLAGIVQLPLQLHWQMKQVSIALILARIAQIISLILIIFVFFPNVDFSNPNPIALTAFLLVLWSVFLSGLVQYFYVYWKGKKFMKFKLNFDKSFIKEKLKTNWKYGLSYYLSSFHTLIVLIFLSIIFPTEKWFTYVGIWALALALIEILLIVPSAFWNSIIHKISSYKKEEKQKSLGWFLTFIIWFGFVMLFNFILFAKPIVYIIAWEKYLTNINHIGSDYVLPFLSIVLFLSFIKQVFNYILVSFEKQNKLFEVNLFWVSIWTLIALVLIPTYNIYWGIVTQVVLELLFVIWAIYIARKYSILPILDKKVNFVLVVAWIGFIIIWYLFVKLLNISLLNIFNFLIIASILNLIILLISYKFIRLIMNKI